MTQKTKARIALTAFLAACLIPSAGMLLLPQGEAAANQTLAPAPRLFLEDGSFNTQVLDEITDYVADHFAFRQEMITAGAALDAAVFLLVTALLFAFGVPQWAWRQLQQRGLPQCAGAAAAAVGYSALFGVSVLTLAGATFNPFIYFQF